MARHRPLYLATIPAIVLLAALAAACGDDDGDGAATATIEREGGGDAASATPREGATPEPSATAEPSATPEPTATSTPEPSPTPAEQTFTKADGGAKTSTPRSSGPLGIIYADTSAGFDAARNRLLASAFVNVGINERPSASARLHNLFRAPESADPVTAQISTQVSWRGVLAGNGAGGTRAAVTIRLSVMLDDTTVASTVVHTREQRESALTIGGFDDIGTNEPVNMEAILIPGRLYELRLAVTCEAASGLVGVATHCVFGPSELYDDGYVEWGPRTIIFAP